MGVEVRDKLQALPFGSVEVGGPIGERIQKTIENNLLVLNVEEDFLQPFREKSAVAESYVGLGKLIDAVVRLAAQTRDERLTSLKKQLIGGVTQAQLADGYIGLFAPELRVWGLWDVHETSYIIYGLISDYELFGNSASLDAARRAADCVIREWADHPGEYLGKGRRPILMTACGADITFMRLTRATGDDKYQEFMASKTELANWRQEIVIGRHGRVEGHAYSHIYKSLSQVERYRLTGEEGLLSQADKVVEFWTKGAGMLITGASGRDECWHNTQDGSGSLGETCATAYSLRLLDSLIRLRGGSTYGDLMERIIYNALFAAQSPDGRRIRYYAPFEGKREFWHLDTYCCPGNYRRIISELPRLIYYQSGNAVTINLYTVSTASFQLADGNSAHLEQVTEYPKSGEVVVKVSLPKPTSFSLKLRIPAWADGASVTVNGEAVGGARSGSYLTIRRRWSEGDEVNLSMPMPWRLVRGKINQAGRVAVMRGPILYTLTREMNPQLDGVDLRQIQLDPESISENGGRLHAKGWLPGTESTQPHDTEFVLTQFTDPAGEMSYFLVPDPRTGSDDELLKTRC